MEVAFFPPPPAPFFPSLPVSHPLPSPSHLFMTPVFTEHGLWTKDGAREAAVSKPVLVELPVQGGGDGSPSTQATRWQ